MVNQLGKFSQSLADLTQPLRQLLSQKSAWFWGPDQDRAFTGVKAKLAKPMVLAHYNPEVPTRVSADASSYGPGAVLMPKVDSQWGPVAYALRSMTETESDMLRSRRSFGHHLGLRDILRYYLGKEISCTD